MSQIIPNLSGFTVIRNGISGDFAMQECIDSLLAICEEVVVGESDSTDGTLEYLQRWADREPRLRIERYPWPNPAGDSKFFVKWLNWTRERLRCHHMIQLDGDEILGVDKVCYQRIREAVERGESLLCDRINYWSAPNKKIPEGSAVGRRVVRVGKSCDWLPSDEGGYRHGELPILDNAKDALDSVKIHHVGFLRRPDAFYRKARVVLKGFFNEFDKRLEPLEKESRPVSEVENVEWTDKLVDYDGPIPDVVQRWFADRGHKVPNYLAALPDREPPKIQIAIPTDTEAIAVRVCGDLGDVIYAMAMFKAIGKVSVHACDRGICKPLLARLHLIQPLLESQPYVTSVQVHDKTPVHWDASDFRTKHRWTQSLAHSHVLHYNGHRHLPRVRPNLKSPWLLGIEPDPRASGRVVINRTPRYHNASFPWKRIVEHLGPKLLFVGLESEHKAFCAEFGHVEYLPSSDLLEVAQLVAGSELVIAGQSCVFAIAEGLKHRRICEVNEFQPDVVVALADNVQYVADGQVKLPAVGDTQELFITSPTYRLADLNTSVVPPGGWQYPGVGTTYHFKVMVSNVANIKGISGAEAKDKLLEHNAQRCPEFFSPSRPEMRLFTEAIQNAVK